MTAYVANNNTTATLTIHAAISGSDGLQKRNNGRIILNGVNTYTGVTDVLAGTLQFSRPEALYGGEQEEWTGENIIVSPGATLAFNVGGWDEFTAEDIDGLLVSLDDESGGLLNGAIIGLDTTNADWWEGFEYDTAISDLAEGASSLGLAKFGANTLILSGENTYSGPTIVAGGSLHVGSDAVALSPDSNLTFRGGVLEASGAFARTLGGGIGQVQWLAQSAGGLGGGFAAVDSDLEVTLNDGAALNWSIAGPFGSSALIFGSLNATHKVTLTNGFALNAVRTIRVDAGLGGDSAELSGVLTNANGGIAKTGNGRLILSNANTYGAATTLSGGTLEIRHGEALGTTGTGTTIQTAGGRLALGGGITVAENLTIQARNSGEHLLNVDGDNTLTGTLTWSTGGLAYGVYSDAGKLTIAGAVNPLGAGKTLNVGGEGDVEFSGVVGDTTTGVLTVVKHGGGTVTFAGGNAHTGNTTIGGGTLVLGSSDTLADTSTIFIAGGAELRLPNPGTSIVATLFIGGEPQPEGTYDEDNTDGAITGEGKIQVVFPAGPDTAFEDWIAANYPEIPEHLSGPDDDPDFDGTPNILEFALRGNPDDGSDNGLIASLIEDSRLKLVAAVRAGAVFENATATVDGVTYTVEGSHDLDFPGTAVSSAGPFDDAPAATGLPGLAGTEWEYHIFTLDASEGLTGKGFLRLKVTRP